MDDYLAKPVEVAELKSLLKRNFSGQGSALAAPAAVLAEATRPAA